MEELKDITLDGEVWKSVNEFDSSIHNSWVVSNYGRVFRLSYKTSHNKTFPLSEVKIKFHKNNHCLFSCGVGKKRKQLSLPLVVFSLFNDEFTLKNSTIPKYFFKDGNFKNNHIDNIVVIYPLKEYPELVWDLYERISDSIKHKKFRYALNQDLKDLFGEELLIVFNEWKKYHGCLYYECPPTGSAFVKLISDTLKSVGLLGGIDEWLIFNGKNTFDLSNDKFFRYISNCGTFHNSRVECFVRNVYYHLGLIDENFRQESFSKIINKKIIGYDPKPDEFFIHPKNNTLVISETFGVAYNNLKNDKRGNNYVKKAKKKYKIYSDYVFIDLWTKGLNMRDVLNLLNKKLLDNDIIDEPISFNENLLPKGEKSSIIEKLNDLKNELGIFSMDDLKLHDSYIHGKLSKYCSDLNVTPTKFLCDNIFEDIDLIETKSGVFSIKTYENHKEITNEVSQLVKSGVVTKPKDLYNIDTALYWRCFRMVRSMDKIMSVWFNETYPNVIRRDKNTILTEKDVKWIKENKNNFMQKEIAEKFNVNKSTIADIIHGRTWKHI